MGLFDFGKKDKVLRELAQEVHELKQLAFSSGQGKFDKLALQNVFANINQNLAIYPTMDLKNQTDRYTGTDDIYSIIRLLATTAALIPLYGYLQTPDQKAFAALKREVKGYKNPLKYKSLQTKALTDLPDDDPVAYLLDHPHETMSKYEFFEAVYSFLCLDGEAFILKERPDDGVNAGKTVQMHILYPQNVVIKVSQSLPRKIVAYDYRVNGVIIHENLPPEDIIHIKYFNPEISYMGGELRGFSPLRALKKRLTRLDSNMDTSVAQIQNGGVETIVYDKSLNGTEKIDISGKRKDNFYRFMSDPANAGAPFFASGEMGVIQLGSHLSDLGILELANVDFKKLCNAFGVSDILFNSDAAATESNVALMTKRLYTNTVLPNVYRVRDALIAGLLSDFMDGVFVTNIDGEVDKIAGDGKKRFIDADISDITELHEDLGKRAKWMASAWWLTANEKREMMNYERYDDPLFDQPFIPANIQSLEDFEQVFPIDPITPNGN